MYLLFDRHPYIMMFSDFELFFHTELWEPCFTSILSSHESKIFLFLLVLLVMRVLLSSNVYIVALFAERN